MLLQVFCRLNKKQNKTERQKNENENDSEAIHNLAKQRSERTAHQ
jgi:hypothetical protein